MISLQWMWEPRRLRTTWAFPACYRNSFTLLRLLTIDQLAMNVGASTSPTSLFSTCRYMDSFALLRLLTIDQLAMNVGASTSPTSLFSTCRYRDSFTSLRLLTNDQLAMNVGASTPRNPMGLTTSYRDSITLLWLLTNCDGFAQRIAGRVLAHAPRNITLEAFPSCPRMHWWCSAIQRMRRWRQTTVAIAQQ
jgi:hypothetical protein